MSLANQSEIVPAPPQQANDDFNTFDQKKFTEDEVIMRSPFEDLDFKKTLFTYKKAAALALLAAFSTAADGYQISITGTIIANAGFIKQFGTAHDAKGALILDANVLAVWGGIQNLGQGFGMLSVHFIADWYGRKMAFYSLWLFLLCGVCCESFGKVWQVWLIGKLTSGIAVGAVQFLTGLYISEISPSRIRGFLIIACSLWYGFGQLFASLALKVLNDRNPNNYLDVIYTEWAMLGIMLIIYLYIPESPYWYANHEQHEQGRKIIQRLNGGIKDYDVEYHYDIIRRTVEKEKEISREIHGDSQSLFQNLRELREIFVGVNGFRTLIAFMPSAVQQIGGLAVLSTYSSYFAQVANFADPFLFSLLLAMSVIIITFISAITTDWIGRRALFLGYVVSTWFVCLIIGGMGLIKNPTHSTNSLVVFFSIIWRMTSSALGNMHWSYSAETASSRLRAKTAGIASAGGVGIGVLFSSTVPYMLNANYANWGLKTCFFFAGVSAPACIACFFIMPDTSKRTPAELDEMFEKKVKPWKFRGYVTDAQLALKELRDATGETDAVHLQGRTVV